MSDRVRLDVWLDVACIARTRSQAKELCDGGKVEIAGARAKAHRTVQAGDRIHIALAPGVTRELVVREVRDTHVARARARELYEDVTPPPTPEEVALRRLERFAPPPAPARGSGRPEKRARRQMDRFRGRREP
ncbi:MAG: S4 domain-containing protein [Thermoanaerobaculaceae bacterium]|nr:S4 domain-containing protein [Thermoanaerobaculaceae bacterium]TAM48767.1 MAG: RNA-binding S4 domain-containing protein [Acidobacteriota bacterium]